MRHVNYSFLTLLKRTALLLPRRFRQILVFLVITLLLDLAYMLQASRPTIQPPVPAIADKEAIYVACLFWNAEELIREHFAPMFLELVRHFGKDKIYISIVASRGWDDTEGALRELEFELDSLGVEKSIILQNRTHAKIGEGNPYEEWIDTPRGKGEIRRIPYLAGLRNQAMEKLKDLADRKDRKMVFKRVVWINDVVANSQQVLDLLSTNDGHFSAACSLDFSTPPYLYDTFALRDLASAPIISTKWPYFLSRLPRSSFQTLSPVPLKACWNGIVVFDAYPFYLTPPLKFRALPLSLAKYHLEASECCLIHADNPLQNGVYLNPNVRVAYNAGAYKLVNPINRKWPGIWQKVTGTWLNRWARWTGWPGRYFSRRRIEGRIAEWQNAEVGNEYHSGKYCIVDEMQVLAENGWAHV